MISPLSNHQTFPHRSGFTLKISQLTRSDSLLQIQMRSVQTVKFSGEKGRQVHPDYLAIKTSTFNRGSHQYVEVAKSKWGFGMAVLESVEEDEFIIGESLRSNKFARRTNIRCLTLEYTGELVFPTSVDFNRQYERFLLPSNQTSDTLSKVPRRLYRTKIRIHPQ